MQETIESLTNRVIDIAKRSEERYLIAIAGVPGSGKTTIADKLSLHINSKVPHLSVVVPMDGFHYYKSELDKMPDPEKAHARRGAPWTFNSKKFLDKVREIKTNSKVTAPSFEHHIADPVEEDIKILPENRIVIVPGIYVLVNDEDLDGGTCSLIGKEFNERWFMDIDLEKSMDILAERHMRAWGWPKDKAVERVNSNDRINSEIIMKSKSNATHLINHIFDPDLVNYV